MNYINIMDRMRLGLDYPKRSDLLYQNLKCVTEDFSMSLASTMFQCPSFACRFSPSPSYSNILAVANEDGHIGITDTTYIKTPIKQGFEAHGNAIFDIAWAKSQPFLASASGDNSVVIWDISEGRNTALYKFLGHTRSVKNVSCRPNGNNIFASGGRDGVICVWDSRVRPDGEQNISPDGTIVNAHYNVPVKTGLLRYRNVTNHITALCFQDEYHLISGSTSDGILKVWDLRKTYTVHRQHPAPRYSLTYPIGCIRNGYTDLVVSPCGLRLYASCNDSHIYCFNISTYESNPICTYTGREVCGYYIRIAVSPCGRYIASGSSDNWCYIWSIDESYPVAILQGHIAEVTCMDWCKNGKELKMASCSNDACYRIWRLNTTEEDFNKRAYQRLIESNHPKKFFTSYFNNNIRKEKEHEISPHVEPVVKRVKLDKTPVKNFDVNSPTANLPNYIVDGTSPHDHVCTKKVKTKETDWFTILKQTPSGEKMPMNISGRRSSGPKSSNNVPKAKAKESLLKYFVIKNPKTNKLVEECIEKVNESCDDEDPSPLPNL